MVCLSFVGCSDDEKRLEGKWQLRYYEFPDGNIQKVDSVFYNFQKGTFSAICLTADNEYETFFGNYSLHSDKISIILLDGYTENKYYERYLGWPDERCLFEVIELSSDKMCLQNGDTLCLFRKY